MYTIETMVQLILCMNVYKTMEQYWMIKLDTSIVHMSGFAYNNDSK
jgi:hypothetical protein